MLYGLDRNHLNICGPCYCLPSCLSTGRKEYRVDVVFCPMSPLLTLRTLKRPFIRNKNSWSVTSSEKAITFSCLLLGYVPYILPVGPWITWGGHFSLTPVYPWSWVGRVLEQREHYGPRRQLQ